MNRVLSALKDNITNIGKIFFLMLFCIITGFVISFPLWKFATTTPHLYTAISLGVIGIMILLFISKMMKNSSTKKMTRIILKFFIYCSGISGSIFLVLKELRLFAFLSLVLMLGLIFLCNILLYEKEQD